MGSDDGHKGRQGHMPTMQRSHLLLVALALVVLMTIWMSSGGTEDHGARVSALQNSGSFSFTNPGGKGSINPILQASGAKPAPGGDLFQDDDLILARELVEKQIVHLNDWVPHCRESKDRDCSVVAGPAAPPLTYEQLEEAAISALLAAVHEIDHVLPGGHNVWLWNRTLATALTVAEARPPYLQRPEVAMTQESLLKLLESVGNLHRFGPHPQRPPRFTVPDARDFHQGLVHELKPYLEVNDEDVTAFRYMLVVRDKEATADAPSFTGAPVRVIDTLTGAYATVTVLQTTGVTYHSSQPHAGRCDHGRWDTVKPLIACKLHGVQVLCPGSGEDVLRACYGAGWNHPRTDVRTLRQRPRKPKIEYHCLPSEPKISGFPIPHVNFEDFIVYEDEIASCGHHRDCTMTVGASPKITNAQRLASSVDTVFAFTRRFRQVLPSKRDDPFWLWAGTLIGAIRSGESIRHDTDHDMAMPWETYQRLLAHLGKLDYFGPSPERPVTITVEQAFAALECTGELPYAGVSTSHIDAKRWVFEVINSNVDAMIGRAVDTISGGVLDLFYVNTPSDHKPLTGSYVYKSKYAHFSCRNGWWNVIVPTKACMFHGLQQQCPAHPLDLLPLCYPNWQHPDHAVGLKYRKQPSVVLLPPGTYLPSVHPMSSEEGIIESHDETTLVFHFTGQVCSHPTAEWFQAGCTEAMDRAGHAECFRSALQCVPPRPPAMPNKFKLELAPLGEACIHTVDEIGNSTRSIWCSGEGVSRCYDRRNCNLVGLTVFSSTGSMSKLGETGHFGVVSASGVHWKWFSGDRTAFTPPPTPQKKKHHGRKKPLTPIARNKDGVVLIFHHTMQICTHLEAEWEKAGCSVEEDSARGDACFASALQCYPRLPPTNWPEGEILFEMQIDGKLFAKVKTAPNMPLFPVWEARPNLRHTSMEETRLVMIPGTSGHFGVVAYPLYFYAWGTATLPAPAPYKGIHHKHRPSLKPLLENDRGVALVMHHNGQLCSHNSRSWATKSCTKAQDHASKCVSEAMVCQPESPPTEKGDFYLAMQADGNLCTYVEGTNGAEDKVVWCGGQPTAHCPNNQACRPFQLVLFSSDGGHFGVQAVSDLHPTLTVWSTNPALVSLSVAPSEQPLKSSRKHELLLHPTGQLCTHAASQGPTCAPGSFATGACAATAVACWPSASLPVSVPGGVTYRLRSTSTALEIVNANSGAVLARTDSITARAQCEPHGVCVAPTTLHLVEPQGTLALEDTSGSLLWQSDSVVEFSERLKLGGLGTVPVPPAPEVLKFAESQAILIAFDTSMLLHTATAVELLRTVLHCDLPVQLWHRNSALSFDNLDEAEKLAALRSQHDVTFHSIQDFQEGSDPDCTTATLTMLMLRYTEVRHVIILDPASLLVKDPSSLFSLAEYKQSGALAFTSKPAPGEQGSGKVSALHSWLESKTSLEDSFKATTALAVVDRYKHWNTVVAMERVGMVPDALPVKGTVRDSPIMWVIMSILGPAPHVLPSQPELVIAAGCAASAGVVSLHGAGHDAVVAHGVAQLCGTAAASVSVTVNTGPTSVGHQQDKCFAVRPEAVASLVPVEESGLEVNTVLAHYLRLCTV